MRPRRRTAQRLRRFQAKSAVFPRHRDCDALRAAVPKEKRQMKKLLFAAILVATTARAEVDGKVARTYKAKCASCHGADGRGETDQGKKLKVVNLARSGLAEDRHRRADPHRHRRRR